MSSCLDGFRRLIQLAAGVPSIHSGTITEFMVVKQSCLAQISRIRQVTNGVTDGLPSKKRGISFLDRTADGT